MIPYLPRVASSSSLAMETPHRANDQAPASVPHAAKPDRVELAQSSRETEGWLRASAEAYLDTSSLPREATARRYASAEEFQTSLPADGLHEHGALIDVMRIIEHASPLTLQRMIDERHARPLSGRLIRAVRQRLAEHQRSAQELAVLLAHAPPPLAERSPRELRLHEADLRRARDADVQRELLRSVDAAVRSSDPAVRFEGETAHHVMREGSALVRFNHVLEDANAANRRRGEVDVETPDAIIECTTGKGRSRKVGQITRTLQDPRHNPAGKPVILRADYVSPHVESALHENGATVARTPEALTRQLAVLKRIRLGEFAGSLLAGTGDARSARESFVPSSDATVLRTRT